MTEPVTPPKPSDLTVRVLSAIVMIVAAGGAFWAGGWAFKLFVLAIAIGLVREWWGLVSKFATGDIAKTVWMLGGLIYIGCSAYMIAALRGDRPDQMLFAAGFVILVAAIDVGAYFAGRTFGGPKIAPTISPSKTWAGLLGGMVAATIIWFFGTAWEHTPQAHFAPITAVLAGPLLAGIAQAGDFFESWMKRKAGVKDSGTLIPGHGGLFDRLDGLLAVLFVVWLTQ